ncbi:MAG: MMPL family transporter [Solirubrobacterales bacterium]
MNETDLDRDRASGGFSEIHLRRPRISAAFLVIVLGLMVACSVNVRSGLKLGSSIFQAKSAESAQIQNAFARVHGFRPDRSLVLLVDLPEKLPSHSARVRIDEVSAEVHRLYGTAKIARPRKADDPVLLSSDGHLAALLVGVEGSELQARRAAAGLTRAFQSSHDVRVGGFSAFLEEMSRSTNDDLRRSEIVAVPIVAMLLLWFFRGFAASLIPFVAAAISAVFGTFALRIASELTEISVYALSFVTGLAVGLGIDCSLLFVARYREELERSPDRRAALRATIQSAGRTVAISGSLVGASLASLLIFPQPFIYSMGLGGAGVALGAVFSTLVVTPVILLLLGDRIGASRRPSTGERGEQSGASQRLIGRIAARPKVVALASGAIILALAAPIVVAQFSFADDRALPEGSGVREVHHEIDREFAKNSLSPMYVVVEDPAPSPKALAAQFRRDGRVEIEQVSPIRVYGGLLRLNGVEKVVPFQRGDGIALASVVSSYDPMSVEAQDLVKTIREATPNHPLIVGGYTATLVDLKQSIRARLPLLALLLASILLIGIFVLTRSVVIAVKSLLMAIVTIFVTLGVLVIGFQLDVFGGILDFGPQDSIGAAEAMVLIALVAALSTDYAAFLLSRIKEAHDAGLPDREAIEFGMYRTGRVITSAALLMAAALGAFLLASNVYLKQLGFGVAFAVLFDALMIRSVLVPALMLMLGKWNWWTPRLSDPTPAIEHAGE